MVPCLRCGAVNDATATACYQCHSHFPGRTTNAPGPAQPAREASGPLQRPHLRLAFGAAIFAAISILSYYGYSKRWLVDASHPPSASNDASGRDSRTDAGVVLRDAAARVTHTAKADERAVPVHPASAERVTPIPGASPAAAIRSRNDREPAMSQESKVTATAVARTKASNTAKSSERGQSRDETCTEAVAALGLCTFRPAEKKETEKAVLGKAEIARPQSAAAGKAIGQELPRGQTCTTAAAALGLCAPRLPQEGK